MLTKESRYENYGKGSPGYSHEVRLYRDGKRIARAFGPNVSGWHIGEFRDLAAVRTALQLPDGPIPDEALQLLSTQQATTCNH